MRPKVYFVLATVCFGFATAANAQAGERFPYEFSYVFESGGRLSGSFEGRPYRGSATPFHGAITVLAEPTIATYVDPSGVTFTWDTRLPTDTSSQVGLISPSEWAFVSHDGSKMDIAFSSGLTEPTQVYLENGIQQQGQLNNASSINLLSTDLSEPFRPENWTLTGVPEPAGLACTSAGMLLGLILVRRKIQPRAGCSPHERNQSDVVVNENLQML